MQAHPHAHPSPLPLPQFFLVGRILTRTDTAAALKLKVDDGTGTLEVVHYLEDGGNELVSRAGGVLPGGWVYRGSRSCGTCLHAP